MMRFWKISRRAFRYFGEQSDPGTGLVLDRARTDGRAPAKIASIAATGFGLTALAIAAARGWIDSARARDRVRTTLRFFAARAQQAHGWFYHWMDAATGERCWDSEISSIDSALLLAGVLTAAQSFQEDPEINAKLIEQAITPKTRAILPVHLGMRFADLDVIMAHRQEAQHSR